MTRIDKMLYEARLLDARTREYKPCVIVEKTISGKWAVRGSDKQFDTEDHAAAFCKEQAGGRFVGIVFDDIPRVPYKGDYIDTCTKTEAEAMKELIEHGYKGTS